MEPEWQIGRTESFPDMDPLMPKLIKEKKQEEKKNTRRNQPEHSSDPKQSNDEDPIAAKEHARSGGARKLPKYFAQKVLDYELKLDAGKFDLDTIDKLMQLYSQAVEYYSGMNDEKYMYFTERIQNTLLRPEILALMQQQNLSNDKDKKEIIQKQKEEKD